MRREFATELLERALKGGTDEAEVYVRTSRNLTIEVKEQKVDTLEVSRTTGYSVRVIKDRRLGFSYSTDPDEIRRVAERAIEASQFSEPDEHNGFPFPAEPSAVKVLDNDLVTLAESDALDLVMSLERTATQEDSRIKKIRKAAGSFSVNETSIFSSHGVALRYSSTGCSAQITAIAEEGTESQMSWDYEGSRFLGEVSFERVGRNAARKAVLLLGAEKTTPVRGSIILDSSTAFEFLHVLSSALSAESVQKRKSMLAGKVGESLLSPTVNIVDDGVLDGMLGSRPVDDEGCPAMSKTLIEKGVLKGFLHNTYTARKDGVHSTGNAVRGGFTGLPSVGPTNFFIQPVSGEYATTLSGLMAYVDRGLYVIETMGMHTANPISGEFSIGVSGLWIEKGKVSHPVKEAVISGNILDLFRNIPMVGDDLRFYGSIGAPSLLIEGIDISG